MSTCSTVQASTPPSAGHGPVAGPGHGGVRRTEPQTPEALGVGHAGPAPVLGRPRSRTARRAHSPPSANWLRWHDTAATLSSMVAVTSTHTVGSRVPDSSAVSTWWPGPASGK